MPQEEFYWVLKITGAALGVGAALILLAVRWYKVRKQKASERIARQINDEKFAPQYTPQEIQKAVQGYIKPDCSVTDPANESDPVAYADVRQNIFEVVDDAITYSGTRRYQLILADSGMGKTSFCLNYFSHFRSKKSDENIALINLSQGDALKRIRRVERKSSTVLILDALDEDSEAIARGMDRIYELLQESADFRSVIITCRSQFFPNDAAIPAETGVSMVTPRRAGQNSSYKLHRLYLTPFSQRQIKSYISTHFPIWSLLKIGDRRKAFRLVSSVPELSARPMLLELLPMLIEEGQKSHEIFGLYRFMVQKWLDREASWISPEILVEISKKLAVHIHRQQLSGGGDKVTLMDLRTVAREVSDNEADWAHLTTRSLLNRDGAGYFKFAHRSIMEYLFVVEALEMNPQCFDLRWTDFMRELFVSWGYTDEGQKEADTARQILRLDLSKTSLLPLSDPPARASLVTLEGLVKAADYRRKVSGNKRSANPLWRRDSVRIADGLDTTELIDLEFNLSWQLPLESVPITFENPFFRNTIAQTQRQIPDTGEDRLPSFAEFITLLECLEAHGRPNLVKRGHLFLLGDKLGDRRHLVVSVDGPPYNSEFIRPIDRDRVASFTERKVTTYEAGMFVHPASLQHLKVTRLRVNPAF